MVNINNNVNTNFTTSGTGKVVSEMGQFTKASDTNSRSSMKSAASLFKAGRAMRTMFLQYQIAVKTIHKTAGAIRVLSKVVDKHRFSVMSTAAVISSFNELAPGETIAENFEKSTRYAEALRRKLLLRDIITHR